MASAWLSRWRGWQRCCSPLGCAWCSPRKSAARLANNALWVIANVRLGSDPRTKEFLAKRTATGNSRKEILRMLQRYIARELYPLIIDALRPALPGD